MRTLRRLTLAIFCLVACSTIWAQGTPYVVVATTDGNIYRIDTPDGLGSAGTATTLFTKAGAKFSMVIGPNNLGVNANPLLYACDANDGTIIRFDPTSPVNAQTNPAGLIYLGTASQNLRCGRITSSGAPYSAANTGIGDLVVTSSSGLLVFSGATWNAAGAGAMYAAPSDTLTTSTNGGIAQKNTGDLVAVDTTGKVFRTPPPVPTSQGPVGFVQQQPVTQISGLSLSSPLGIARRSDGEMFVSTQGGTPSITHFGINGSNATGAISCETFRGGNKGVPNFLQMSMDDTLYVAITNGTKGIVQSINANSCSSTSIQSYGLSAPVVGIALPPTTATLSLPGGGNNVQKVTAGNGTALFSFGYSGLEFRLIADQNACQGSVLVELFSPATLYAMIAPSGVAADPSVNLALDGFQAVFDTADTALDGCGAVDATKNILVSHFLTLSNINPKVFACDDTEPVPASCTPAAGPVETVTQIGAWPLGGLLPKDLTSASSKSLRSHIFLANDKVNTTDPSQALGTFCGFQSPVNNTYNANLSNIPTAPWDPSLAATLSAGKSIPVKFKLGTGTGASACQSAPYISSATAILSVAQIIDSQKHSTFVPIGLVSNGSSGLGQPLFKGDTNNQYLFNWDSSSCIMPSGVTQVCPKGTYSLTVLLLTNNTNGVNGQSIYGVQTTLVNLK